MYSVLRVLALLIFGLTVSCKKTVLITGGNRGIGLAAVRQLQALGEYDIVIACRSIERANAAIASLPSSKGVEAAFVDLADLTSVRKFADEWKTSERSIDCLCLNAGIQLSSSPTGNKAGTSDPLRTVDGFEATVGTNHIGHFVLLKELLPVIASSGSAENNARVVFVGSGVHNPKEAGGDVGSKAALGDMSGLAAGFRAPESMVDGGNFDADKAYKDSKLCNVVTALELARRLQAAGKPVTSNVLNPGLIPTTGLFRELNPIFVAVFTFLTRFVFRVAVPDEEGGRRLAYLVSSPALNGITGGYYSGKPGVNEFKLADVSEEAAKMETGSRLWELTEKIVAV
jgi:protochlorophyllide reductase